MTRRDSEVMALIAKLREMQRPGAESDLSVMCAEAATALEAAGAQLRREAERYRALVAERDAIAQQAGECSGAVQTMEREISALTADLAEAREDIQTLAGAFWRLDFRGWIDTYYDGDEEECYHIRDIGRLIVDKVRTAIDAARTGST